MDPLSSFGNVSLDVCRALCLPKEGSSTLLNVVFMRPPVFMEADEDGGDRFEGQVIAHLLSRYLARLWLVCKCLNRLTVYADSHTDEIN